MSAKRHWDALREGKKRVSNPRPLTSNRKNIVITGKEKNRAQVRRSFFVIQKIGFVIPGRNQESIIIATVGSCSWAGATRLRNIVDYGTKTVVVIPGRDQESATIATTGSCS